MHLLFFGLFLVEVKKIAREICNDLHKLIKIMKIQFIQAVRGFAALSVVFFHSLIFISAIDRNSSELIPNILNMGDIGVDLFFIVSGFVMVLILNVNEDKFKGVSSWLSSFFLKRLWRMIFPYWIFTALAFVGLTILASKKIIHSSILESLFLIPNNEPFILMVGWSLVYELYFYFLFGLMCYWKGRQGAILAALFCVIFSILLPLMVGSEYLAGVYNLTLPIYFSIGIALALAMKTKNIFLLKFPQWILLVVSFLLFLLIIIFYPVAEKVHTQSVLRVFGYGPIAVSIFLIFWISGEILERFKWFGMDSVGEWSYSLYLSHWLVLNFISLVIGKFGFQSGYWTIIPSVGICLIVGYISWRVVEKPLMQYGKKILSS